MGLCPSIQSFRIPLQRLPTIKQIDILTQPVSTCKLRVCLILSSRLLVKMLNVSGPNTLRNTIVNICKLDLTPLTTTLWAQQSRQFFNQWRIHLSMSWAANFSCKILWKMVSKIFLLSRQTTSTVALKMIYSHNLLQRSDRQACLSDTPSRIYCRWVSHLLTSRLPGSPWFTRTAGK